MHRSIDVQAVHDLMMLWKGELVKEVQTSMEAEVRGLTRVSAADAIQTLIESPSIESCSVLRQHAATRNLFDILCNMEFADTFERV